MAIFNKPNDKSSKTSINASGTTIIAAGTRIKGEIEIECNLHIDGEYEGIVRSQKNVTIGKSGLLKGEVHADKVIISGAFSGSIDSNIVDILSNGKLFGSVIAKEFVIERGGFFEGDSKTKDSLNLENAKPLILDSNNT
ncbi:polymer-forming cytoskeletal family protein [Arcobacter sp. HD9-500m-PIT-SAG02]|nr:polymer-forming cytoskeletal family protein [Arcobacter sp. HD9-500m-PIT-SAG02]